MEPRTGGREGTVDALISREIVAVYVEFYGRGPTKARTTHRDELVVCLLEDVFGKGEQVLIGAGHFEQVQRNRQAVREQVEPRIRAVVEGATGSPVEICLGQVTEAGLASEVCLLATTPTPAGLRGRDRPEAPRPG